SLDWPLTICNKWIVPRKRPTSAPALVPPLDVVIPLRGRRLGDIDRIGRRKGLFEALRQGVVEPALFLGRAGVDRGSHARSGHGVSSRREWRPAYELRDAIWLTIHPG